MDEPTPPRRWEPDTLSQLLVRVESQQHQINELRDTCVTKTEFNPIRAIAYGIVGVFMTAVLMAIAAMVVKGRIGP